MLQTVITHPTTLGAHTPRGDGDGLLSIGVAAPDAEKLTCAYEALVHQRPRDTRHVARAWLVQQLEARFLDDYAGDDAAEAVKNKVVHQQPGGSKMLLDSPLKEVYTTLCIGVWQPRPISFTARKQVYDLSLVITE